MDRKPKTTGPRARDPGAFKYVLVRINADGWKALKMLAIESESTLNALAVEAFNDLKAWQARKRGKSAARLVQGFRAPARLELPGYSKCKASLIADFGWKQFIKLKTCP